LYFLLFLSVFRFSSALHIQRAYFIHSDLRQDAYSLFQALPDPAPPCLALPVLVPGPASPRHAVPRLAAFLAYARLYDCRCFSVIYHTPIQLTFLFGFGASRDRTSIEYPHTSHFMDTV